MVFVTEMIIANIFFEGRSSIGSVQKTILTTGHDVKFTDDNYKSIWITVKETIVMGWYHDASHPFSPLKIEEL